MIRLNQLLLSLFVVVAIAVLPCVCLASHPYHVSNAEVNWNPKTGNFEVALCVWPADLEKALAIDQSKIIDLDKVDNLDEMLKTYIEKKFLIRKSKAALSITGETKQGQTKPSPTIRWVGHERDLKTAWLYFEIEGDTQGGPWTVENRVFFELNDDQLNQVQTTIGKSSDIVVCRLGSFRHAIDTSRFSSQK